MSKDCKPNKTDQPVAENKNSHRLPGSSLEEDRQSVCNGVVNDQALQLVRKRNSNRFRNKPMAAVTGFMSALNSCEYIAVKQIHPFENSRVCFLCSFLAFETSVISVMSFEWLTDGFGILLARHNNLINRSSFRKIQ